MVAAGDIMFIMERRMGKGKRERKTFFISFQLLYPKRMTLPTRRIRTLRRGRKESWQKTSLHIFYHHSTLMVGYYCKHTIRYDTTHYIVIPLHKSIFANRMRIPFFIYRNGIGVCAKATANMHVCL